MSEPDPAARRTTRLLTLWCAGLSLAWIGLLAVVVTAHPTPPRVIEAERINLREPDGRLRLAISNRARFPGAIVRGRETVFDRASAGMIFYNDEATENGGLIVSGATGADGKVRSVGHLSFDQYEQDQVVNLQQEEEGGSRSAGLSIADRPDAALDVAAGLRLRNDPAALKRALAQGAFGAGRAFLGKTPDHASRLELKDAGGAVRLRLIVAADGKAAIEFLDKAGAVTKTVAP